MQPLGTLHARVLPALLARAPMSPEKLSFVWGQAVGGAMARASTVTLSGTTLAVRTAETAWAREIQRSRTLILGRVQALLGADTVSALTVEDTSGGTTRRR
jgi:predicted nucleic acid-binding Zn ribbon protein